VQADSQTKSSGLVLCRRPLGAVLHSSNKPGELSEWLCHDDSTINIFLELLLLLIIINIRTVNQLGLGGAGRYHILSDECVSAKAASKCAFHEQFRLHHSVASILFDIHS